MPHVAGSSSALSRYAAPRRPPRLRPLAAATTIRATTGRDRVHVATKLLLAPTLAAGVAATAADRSPRRTATLLVALAGSTAGDWWMHRSGRARRAGDERAARAEMRRGASAFAVQQAGFLALLLRSGTRPTGASVAPVAAVLAGLAALDSADGSAPDPVLTGYGVLLGEMSALALEHGRTPGADRAARGVGLGGLLFLVSDAAIILGEHLARRGRAARADDGVVLGTYTAALALLVHGLRDR